LGIGESTATAWVGRWRQTGRVEAKSQKGLSRSPLKRHSDWLLALIGERADLTLAIRAKETLTNADMAGV
jgi:transposase